MTHDPQKRRLFRQKALERLSSPEQLDQAVRIIRPQDWLPLGVLGALVAVGVIWSVVGRLPMTVTGQGILINPRRMIQFQSPISGQLEGLMVQDGQCVERNQVLATIEPSDLKQQLQLQQERLIQLQQQATEDRDVREQRTALEQEAIAAQQASLQQRLQDAQSLTPVLQNQSLNAIAEQRSSLQQQLQDARELAPIFAARVQNRQRLLEAGAISEDTLLDVELEARQARQNIADLEAQLEQLNLQAVETQQRYVDNLSKISQIQAQLEELQSRSKRLEQENLEAIQVRNREQQDVQRAIAQLNQQISDNSRIQSPQAGCILEITASAGQVVDPGTRLGTIQVAGGDATMIETTVLYFAVKDGKQIQPGMTVFVTPSPVKRERFGSIVGEVVSVSPFPITRAGAASVVGNPELADQLIGQEGGKIEVVAQLKGDPSTFSGYQWSSSNGPDLKLTLGTTATARVAVEERAPITFLLPILREWSGID
ncbi:MAG: NHLP bacteriocin system secretion protein [Leptolyngbya sp. SIO1D8]|nr:NHLP bacteriocin system secretion protein [Leptolyngbya sp. SIO1D8]